MMPYKTNVHASTSNYTHSIHFHIHSFEFPFNSFRCIPIRDIMEVIKSELNNMLNWLWLLLLFSFCWVKDNFYVIVRKTTKTKETKWKSIINECVRRGGGYNGNSFFRYQKRCGIACFCVCKMFNDHKTCSMSSNFEIILKPPMIMYGRILDRNKLFR